MSFSTGGFVLKNAASLSDEDILALLKRNGYTRMEKITADEASGSAFRNTAILRTGDVALVFDIDKTFSCAFEESEVPSNLDERLAALSAGHDILCFVLDGHSDTYSWIVYQKGERRHVKSESGGEPISDFGEDTGYENDDPSAAGNLMKMLDKFTGTSFFKLSTGSTKANAYYQ